MLWSIKAIKIRDHCHAIKPLTILLVIFIMLKIGLAFKAWGETKGEAPLEPLGEVADLVDIRKVNPRIIVGMKYATEDNFTKKRLYESNTCFLRKSTALKLDAVQKELEGMNLGLKVWDCYRPLGVQRILWQILPDERYVANPEKGSRHNRACSVDVTLVDPHGRSFKCHQGSMTLVQGRITILRTFPSWLSGIESFSRA